MWVGLYERFEPTGFIKFVASLSVVDVSAYVRTGRQLPKSLALQQPYGHVWDRRSRHYMTMVISSGLVDCRDACNEGGKARAYAAIIRMVDVLVPSARVGVGGHVEVGGPDSETSPSVQNNCDDDFKKV